MDFLKTKCSYGKVMGGLGALAFGLGIGAGEVLGAMPQDSLPLPRQATIVSPILSLPDVTYDPERGNEFDIERKILGIGVSLPLGPQVYGDFGLGLITETEVENYDEEGDGYQLLFGAKGTVHRSGQIAVHVNGSFSLLNESIKDNNVKHELETTELRLGSTVSALVSPKVVPYAGMELTLLSDGSWKTTSPAGTGKFDFERDDILGLRLGAKFLLGQTALKAEALLLGERTITLGLDISL